MILLSSLAFAADHNFLVIVADDVGTDEVGIYGESPTAPATPNIDALAREGVWFRNAYVTPVCSSSRAMLMTGRYGRRTGLGGIIDTHERYELPLAEITIPEALDASGTDWSAAAIGKWHLSNEDSPTSYRHPLLQGFDRHRGSIANLANGRTIERGNYSRWEKNVDGTPTITTKYASLDTTDEAIDALRELKAPFFLYVAYNAAHEPFHDPDEGDKGSEKDQYVKLVESMDTQVGRLLAAMTPTQRATTTIVFVGDNGTPQDVVRRPYRGDHGKGTLYEGGTNVPLVVAGAGVTGRGESAGLVSGVDLLPTLLDLAGVSTRGLALDGVSFAPLLDRPKADAPRRFVYTEKFGPNGGGPYRYDQVAIRDERYKIIRFGPDEWGRYDLRDRYDDGRQVSEKVAPERFAALEAELKRLRAELTYGAER